MLPLLALLALFLGAGRALIQEITDEHEPRLKELMESNGEAFLMFHADWCGACQHFKPVYKQFGEMMAAEHPSVPLYSVHNDHNPKLVARFQLAYLPSIFHIRDGKVRNVSSLRNDLEKYVTERQWEQIKPVNEHLTPYSTVGNVLALCGSLGYKVLEVCEGVSKKTGVNQTIVLATLVIGFFVLFYGSIFYFAGKQDSKEAAQKKQTRRAAKKNE